MSRLRILCVEPLGLFPSHFEGVALRVCGGLADRGHDITLLTYAGLRSHPSPDKLPFKLLNARRSSSSGLVAALPGDLGYSLRRLTPFWITFRSAFRLASDEEFDCVYFLDWHPVLLLLCFRLFGCAKRKRRTRFLGLLHTSEKLRKKKAGIEERYRRFFVRCLGKLGFEYLDSLVVLHESLKEELISGLHLRGRSAHRIQVIPHGMDSVHGRIPRAEARKYLGWPADDTTFVMFGTLRWEKRPDVAIQGIAGLPGCRLVVAGLPGYWNENRLRVVAKDASCEEAVTFQLRFIDEHEIGEFLSAADAVLVPYARAFKGASGVLAHACSHKRAVIASNIPAFGRDVRRHQIGLLFEADQPESLRDAIVRFCLLNKEERRAMERHAEDWARHNSWESHCEKLEQLMLGKGAERALVSQ